MAAGIIDYSGGNLNVRSGSAQGKGLISNPIGTSAGQTGYILLRELIANGSNHVGFKAPDSLTTNLVWTLPNSAGTGGQVLSTDGSGTLSWISPGGGGTVTSVNAQPATGEATSLLSITGGPITGSGTFVFDLASQNTNTVFAGPDGSSGKPTFRLLTANDIPSFTSTKITDFNEAAQDAVGNILTDSASIDFTYNDAANTITGVVLPNTTNQRLVVTNNGTLVGTRKEINFIPGTGISYTITDNNVSDRVDVTITNSATIQAYTTVQEEGSALTQRSVLNFVGTGFTAADDSANSRTNVTLDSDLNAVADLSTTGLITRTGTGTAATRSIVAGSSKISVTNGSAVSGDPTVDLGSVTLDDLSDVVITTASTGNIVRYNGTNWVNANLAGADVQGFTAGSVIFAGVGGSLTQDNPNLFFDDTNNRLGIGNSTPTQPLDVTGNIRGTGTITGAGIVATPTGTGVGAAGYIRLNELVANGTNYVGLKAPDNLAANVTFTLPSVDGTVGQAIVTDGAGNLSFADVEYTQTATTTNATPTSLAPGLTLTTNSAMTFHALVVGRDSSGNMASWKVEGGIKRGAGTASIVDVVVRSLLASDTSAVNWDVSATASTNDLTIQVTGAAATTINWRAKIRYVTVS